MKVLRKYIDNMSYARKAEFYVLEGLIRKGYSAKKAKALLAQYPGVLEYAENYPDLFFHCDGDYWADFILEAESEQAVG